MNPMQLGHDDRICRTRTLRPLQPGLVMETVVDVTALFYIGTICVFSTFDLMTYAVVDGQDVSKLLC